MDLHLSFKVNEKIFLRNPESSELGKMIVKNAIDLINSLGFEHFTFKKLAVEMSTTEATIYRYFENKHRLLLYILNWYWYYLEFMVDYQLKNVSDSKEKLKIIIHLLTHELPENSGKLDYNVKFLNHIVIAESSKVYFVKEINEINKNQVFKPYKDLCKKIAGVIQEYNPNYCFPRSLSSTLMETAHFQQYFCENLPALTDLGDGKNSDFTQQFLENLVFNALD